MSKNVWKKVIQEKIHEKNKSELLSQIKTYKKLDYDKLALEDYGLHPYITQMNISQARTFFAARSQMLRTVQMNFKRKPEYIANHFKCACGQCDVQAHLTSCRSYEHLRAGLDLSRDVDLVRYYQRVIQEREREAGET